MSVHEASISEFMAQPLPPPRRQIVMPTPDEVLADFELPVPDFELRAPDFDLPDAWGGIEGLAG